MQSLGLLISHFAERCRAQLSLAATADDAEDRERVLRNLVAEQAALRRVATAVAAESDPRDAFAVVTEEVARLLGAPSANMVRFNDDATATIVANWRSAGRHGVPARRTRVRWPATACPHACSAAARPRGWTATRTSRASWLPACAISATSPPSPAPIFLDGRLWGAVIVSASTDEPFPPGAEQRIADFAELAAQALANAQRPRGAGRVARPHRPGRRRRAPAARAQPPRRRAAAAGVVGPDAAAGRPPAPGRRRDLVQAGEELSFALQELRELARGIHPAVLTERGLEPAVRAARRPGAGAGRAVGRARTSGCPGRSRPPPTTSSPRRSRTWPSTPARRWSAWASSARTAHARIEVRDDGVGGADAGRRHRAARARGPRRGARRAARSSTARAARARRCARRSPCLTAALSCSGPSRPRSPPPTRRPRTRALPGTLERGLDGHEGHLGRRDAVDPGRGRRRAARADRRRPTTR